MVYNHQGSGFSEKQVVIEAAQDLSLRQKAILGSRQPFDLQGVESPVLDTLDVNFETVDGGDNIKWFVNSPILDIAQVEEKKASSKVLAIAPVMSVSLIEPLKGEFLGSPGEDVDLQQLNEGSVSFGVELVGASKSEYTGAGAIVAVLDTGIDLTHPAFEGINFICRNFTSDDGGDPSKVTDYNGHGTHCAGTIFGRNHSGYGRIGVAPGVQTVLIAKVIGKSGAGDSDVIVEAVNWASSHGANIISMSLGFNYPGQVLALSQFLPSEIAVARALEGYRASVIMFDRLAALMRQKNILIIGAAGNDSKMDDSPDFEVGVRPPAVAEAIISVSAIGLADKNNKFNIAPFSNVGANVAGPGVGVISAKVGGGLRRLSGTSMAAPHVAGVAALWFEKLSQQGACTYATLYACLIGRADAQLLDPGLNLKKLGSGLVKAP